MHEQQSRFESYKKKIVYWFTRIVQFKSAVNVQLTDFTKLGDHLSTKCQYSYILLTRFTKEILIYCRSLDSNRLELFNKLTRQRYLQLPSTMKDPFLKVKITVPTPQRTVHSYVPLATPLQAGLACWDLAEVWKMQKIYER